MKQRLFSSLFTAMVGALAFTSCSSDVAEDVKTSSASKQLMTFTASYDNNISSRTSLGSDYSVLWSAGDALSIFDGYGNQDFTIKSGIGSSSAEFKGEAGTAEKYYAVYPYQNDATIEGNVINKVTIPTTQTAIEGTFDPKANVMTAVSNSANNLAFKNFCSYAKITTTFPCKAVVFSNSNYIAGTFKMAIDEDGIGEISYFTSNYTKEVTLVPSEDDPFPAGTYYIAIKPGTIKDLTVYCIGEDQIITNSIPGTLADVFTRASIIDLGEAKVENGWKLHDPQHTYTLGGGSKEYVDFYLQSGTLWAKCNLGANFPEEYGDFYTFGATVPWLEEYHINATTHKISICPGCKWNAEHDSYNDANKVFDFYTRLDVAGTEYDAATHQLGEGWSMPTLTQYVELFDNTFAQYTSNYMGTGVPGLILYETQQDADKGMKIIQYGRIEKRLMIMIICHLIMFTIQRLASGKTYTIQHLIISNPTTQV